MDQGTLVVNIALDEDEKLLLNDLHLITLKPIMYIVNMSESEVGTI